MSKVDTANYEELVYRGKVPEDRLRLMIAYQNGNIQLMYNENNASRLMI